jgi:hypothetical protein
LRFNGLRWPLLLAVSIATGLVAAKSWAADNEKSKFEVKAVAAYHHRQTSEKVTIAAEPYETDEQARDAFGKVNPFRYGVLPVLIVMQNEGPDAVKLEGIKFAYLQPDGKQIEATPAPDVKFIHGTKAPKEIGTPIGIKVKKPPKNPLAEWEIEGRAFAAKMLPAGQSASGFVYFQVEQTSAAASVDVSGLANPVTGKELFYFEIPLSGN